MMGTGPMWLIIAILLSIGAFLLGVILGALLAWWYFSARLTKAEAQLRECKAQLAASVESKASVPQERDDLKRIVGIGAVYERQLNAAGIYTFAQLAALTPEKLVNMVNIAVDPERIITEDWIGQAAKLAAESGK